MLAGYKGYKQVDDAVRGFDLGLNGTSKVFAFSNSYIHRITLSIVVEELSRNIMLAMVCVFICSLFLIANLPATIIVCFTVAITLTDVAGSIELSYVQLNCKICYSDLDILVNNIFHIYLYCRIYAFLGN